MAPNSAIHRTCFAMSACVFPGASVRARRHCTRPDTRSRDGAARHRGQTPCLAHSSNQAIAAQPKRKGGGGRGRAGLADGAADLADGLLEVRHGHCAPPPARARGRGRARARARSPLLHVCGADIRQSGRAERCPPPLRHARAILARQPPAPAFVCAGASARERTGPPGAGAF